jgi:hypothetical protein
MTALSSNPRSHALALSTNHANATVQRSSSKSRADALEQPLHGSPQPHEPTPLALRRPRSREDSHEIGGHQVVVQLLSQRDPVGTLTYGLRVIAGDESEEREVGEMVLDGPFVARTAKQRQRFLGKSAGSVVVTLAHGQMRQRRECRTLTPQLSARDCSGLTVSRELGSEWRVTAGEHDE